MCVLWMHLLSPMLLQLPNSADSRCCLWLIPQGNFDPQALHMRGVLWMLSSSCVLASLEEPQAGMALTGRLLCIEGEQLLVIFACSRCWVLMLMFTIESLDSCCKALACMVVLFCVCWYRLRSHKQAWH
jgi:hypothetical protein